MRIRRMRRADLPALARMNCKIYPKDSLRQTKIAFCYSLKNQVPGACLVAEEDGKPLGAIFAEKKLTFSPRAAYIKAFFVAEGHRDKGVGTKLFSACMAAMKKNKVKSVSLTVDKKNKKAFSLYRQAGFKPFRLLLLRRF